MCVYVAFLGESARRSDTKLSWMRPFTFPEGIRVLRKLQPQPGSVEPPAVLSPCCHYAHSLRPATRLAQAKALHSVFLLALQALTQGPWRAMYLLSPWVLQAFIFQLLTG